MAKEDHTKATENTESTEKSGEKIDPSTGNRSAHDGSVFSVFSVAP